MTGTRLTDIIMDRHEDHLYEDSRAMRLTPYVMAERCLQAEFAGIMSEYREGDYSTLTHILEGGFNHFLVLFEPCLRQIDADLQDSEAPEIVVLTGEKLSRQAF